jgi:hypothetical protein
VIRCPFTVINPPWRAPVPLPLPAPPRVADWINPVMSNCDEAGTGSCAPARVVSKTTAMRATHFLGDAQRETPVVGAWEGMIFFIFSFSVITGKIESAKPWSSEGTAGGRCFPEPEAPLRESWNLTPAVCADVCSSTIPGYREVLLLRCRMEH